MLYDDATQTRFLAKVVKVGDCWEWQGAKDRDGYGFFRFPHSMPRAHRVAYEMFVDTIPDGLTIDHLCKNKSCVNPAHLEPVTNHENILRGNGLAARNARKTHCKFGHPFTGDNLRVWNGHRSCRECNNRRQREHTARKGVV